MDPLQLVLLCIALCLASPSCFSLSMSSSSSNDPSSRLVYGKDDALFGIIEEQQQGAPGADGFGMVLDAGTGLHSLRWLATLHGMKGMKRCVAVTADATMQRNCQREIRALLGKSDYDPDSIIDVVLGNWFDENRPLLLEKELILSNEGKLFDVILADYLIGAMDGFSPYQQDLMIPRLTQLLKPGGRLYIVGLQPLPDQMPNRRDDANIICKVRQVRDACILLAGHRCYREYPVDWVQRQIEHTSQLRLVQTRQLPILYRYETILKQINVARSKLPLFSSPSLAQSMGAVLDDLDAQAKTATAENGRIQLGFDYIVTAERSEADSP